MATTLVLLQLVIVFAMIFIGARLGGIGLGIYGMLGVAILVFVFGLRPGKLPIDVMLIIVSVITAAASLQAVGGLDYLVNLAARFLRHHPDKITYYGPLTTWFFCLVAGTAHTCYSLLPIISEIATSRKIRPERPLSVATVAASLGITGSPVSAATAAIISTELLGAQGIELGDVLLVCIPSSFVAILVASFVQNRVGLELVDDPEYQRRVAQGLLAPAAGAGAVVSAGAAPADAGGGDPAVVAPAVAGAVASAVVASAGAGGVASAGAAPAVAGGVASAGVAPAVAGGVASAVVAPAVAGGVASAGVAPASAAAAPSPSPSSPSPSSSLNPRAKWGVLAFLLAVFAVVLFGSVPSLRPAFSVVGPDGAATVERMAMSEVIEVVMMAAAAFILLAGKAPATSSGQAVKAAAQGSVFAAGMNAMVGIFGIAWMGDTYFSGNLDFYQTHIAGLVTHYPVFFAAALFVMSIMLFSQAATVRTMYPLGIGLGLSPLALVAMFPAVNGYFFFPNYPTEVAAINFDRTGTTRVGRFVVNHSFQLSGFITTIVSIALGYAIVALFY